METSRDSGNTKKNSISLESDHEVYKIIKKLTPWEINSLQINRGPKSRLGMKPDINWNHRGNVTLNTGDEINFETEFRNDIVLPMQRFTGTIKYGIFFYGFAPDEEQKAAENLEKNHVSEPSMQTQKNLTKVVLQVLRFPASSKIKCLLTYRSVRLVCISILHIAADKI